MNANTPRFNSDAIDNTIDRALSALRDAQPRSGSEMLAGRILASLEHRTVALQPLRPHSSVYFALWTATAAAILAVASMLILHQRSFRPATQTVILSHQSNAVILSERSESKNPETIGRTKNPEPFSTTNLAQTSIEPTHRMAHRAVTTSPAMPVSCAQSGCPIHDGDAPAVMNGVSQTPSDAQLLADLHAPSHPAPPLPLTPEEKLFLRMLHYGNATQIAELNPLVRAKQDADETAAFKAFFPDPPPVQQPNGDTE